jgi:hypothetical protein
MRYHLYREENYRKVRNTLAEGIHKDKTTRFGNSIP